MNHQAHTSAWRIPRTADGLLALLMDQFQNSWNAAMDFTRPDKDITQHHARLVDLYGQIHLLAALRETAPEQADKVAASLADMWDSGDSLGEWVHQWRTELKTGRPLTMLHDDEAGQR
jgi:hypothetical protein